MSSNLRIVLGVGNTINTIVMWYMSSNLVIVLGVGNTINTIVLWYMSSNLVMVLAVGNTINALSTRKDGQKNLSIIPTPKKIANFLLSIHLNLFNMGSNGFEKKYQNNI